MSFYKGLLAGALGNEVLRKILEAAGGKEDGKMLEKVSKFLGLSLEDERRWGQLWARLNAEERKNLTDFLQDECEDYERTSFRHVVVGIPNTKTSHSLAFLKVMAKVIKTSGAKEAKRQCLAGGIIVADPFFRKVIAEWKEAVDWAKKFILSQFNVTSFDQITSEVVKNKLAEIAKYASSIDRSIAAKIPKVERRGFFAEAFGFFKRK